MNNDKIIASYGINKLSFRLLIVAHILFVFAVRQFEIQAPNLLGIQPHEAFFAMAITMGLFAGSLWDYLWPNRVALWLIIPCKLGYCCTLLYHVFDGVRIYWPTQGLYLVFVVKIIVEIATTWSVEGPQR